MKQNRDLTILLVEDVEDDVFFMQRALKQANISNPLQIVFDGREAINYLGGTGKYSDRFQYPIPLLVFLDLKMPQKNGLEVLQWISEQPHLQTLIVIVLTSSSDEGDIKHSYRLGARSFLIKPPTPEMLKELMITFKGYWLTHNKFDDSPTKGP